MIIRSYKGAGMILFHKDADGNVSVLLEKRSDNHSWAIPGGGLSPEDRTLMNTAIRETYEETGISVKDAEPVRIYRLPFFIYEVFASELNEKSVPRKNWESDEIRWFSISELPKEMNWMTEIELNDFIRRKGLKSKSH